MSYLKVIFKDEYPLLYEALKDMAAKNPEEVKEFKLPDLRGKFFNTNTEDLWSPKKIS
jgi:hypothetical protein